MSVNELLDTYFETLKRVHSAFNYEESWRVFPIEDMRVQFWMLVGGEAHGGVCVWCAEPLTKKVIEDGKQCSGPIYTQRHLPKWVYRANGFVMICVDTRRDMNISLFILDAQKECIDEELMALYRECW